MSPHVVRAVLPARCLRMVQMESQRGDGDLQSVVRLEQILSKREPDRYGGSPCVSCLFTIHDGGVRWESTLDASRLPDEAVWREGDGLVVVFARRAAQLTAVWLARDACSKLFLSSSAAYNLTNTSGVRSRSQRICAHSTKLPASCEARTPE